MKDEQKILKDYSLHAKKWRFMIEFPSFPQLSNIVHSIGDIDIFKNDMYTTPSTPTNIIFNIPKDNMIILADIVKYFSYITTFNLYILDDNGEKQIQIYVYDLNCEKIVLKDLDYSKDERIDIKVNITSYKVQLHKV